MAAPRRPSHLRRSPLLVALIAAGLCAACRGDKNPDPGEDRDEPSGDEPAAAPGGLQMMSALLGSATKQPGPYDEPERSDGASEDAPHLAVIELSGEVAELESFGWTSGFSGLQIREVIDALWKQAESENVTGLLLRLTDLSIDMARAEELRAEIAAIRASREGLAVNCFAESAGPVLYYLMSACSDVGLAVGGELAIPGVAAVPIHIKGLLDRAGVTADFIHIGSYKGAAEPLTRDAPSPQARETTEMILDQAFATLVAGIAKDRDLTGEQVKAAIDRGMLDAESAREAKLVDRVAQFEVYRDAVAGETPWRKVSVGGDEDPSSQLLSLLGMAPTPRPTGDRVALVYAVGNVVDGEGQGIVGARTEIASRTVSAALRALAADDAVKAVVLRIDSPGGSALASEIIWTAVGELEKKKPVIVSMASVAASGGYYIAAGASQIFALDNTLTGSIGVVGGKLAVGGAMNKVGVSTHPIGRGKHALLFASPEPWTAEQREVVRRSMADVYQRFAGRVRAGRGDIADELMQGRVWTGAAAREHKLVDSRGGLRAALARARELGEVGADAELEVYPPAPTLKDLMGSFGVSATGAIESELEAAARAVAPRLAGRLLQTARAALGFTRAPIQAVALLPVVGRP
jgi:protease-4